VRVIRIHPNTVFAFAAVVGLSIAAPGYFQSLAPYQAAADKRAAIRAEGQKAQLEFEAATEAAKQRLAASKVGMSYLRTGCYPVRTKGRDKKLYYLPLSVGFRVINPITETAVTDKCVVSQETVGLTDGRGTVIQVWSIAPEDNKEYRALLDRQK
jgi:hypothetical protein